MSNVRSDFAFASVVHTVTVPAGQLEQGDVVLAPGIPGVHKARTQVVWEVQPLNEDVNIRWQEVQHGDTLMNASHFVTIIHA